LKNKGKVKKQGKSFVKGVVCKVKIAGKLKI